MKFNFLAEHPQRLIQMTLAFLWIYQGLFPKLVFPSTFDIQVWQFLGLNVDLATVFVRLSGGAEILFGCAFLIWQRSRYVHYLSITGLIGLLLLSAILAPSQLISAFNPVIMNIAMSVLSVVALQISAFRQKNESTTPLNASLHEYNKMDSSV